jgi:hypothetical protein
MNVTVKLDTRKFDAAMREYVNYTSKTVAYAVNKGLRDAAMRATEYVQPANRNELALWMDLSKKDPGGFISPFVAYLLRKKKAGTVASDSQDYAQGAFTPIWIKGKKRLRVKRGRGRFYTREEAKAFGKKVFAARYRSQTFLRAFFIAAVKRLTALGIAGGYSGKNAKGVPQLQVNLKPATENNPSGGFGVLYNYKRGNPYGEKATAILMRALQMGLNDKAADMRDYIQKKLAELAKAISAK